jgi:hypothetical protein
VIKAYPICDYCTFLHAALIPQRLALDQRSILLCLEEVSGYFNSDEGQKKGELQALWQSLKPAFCAQLILEEHGLM